MLHVHQTPTHFCQNVLVWEPEQMTRPLFPGSNWKGDNPPPAGSRTMAKVIPNFRGCLRYRKWHNGTAVSEKSRAAGRERTWARHERWLTFSYYSTYTCLYISQRKDRIHYDHEKQGATDKSKKCKYIFKGILLSVLHITSMNGNSLQAKNTQEKLSL